VGETCSGAQSLFLAMCLFSGAIDLKGVGLKILEIDLIIV